MERLATPDELNELTDDLRDALAHARQLVQAHATPHERGE